MTYDASPSWSGFNYQGKVALYYALKIINKCCSADKAFDFSTHKLILENNEDFEIEESGHTVSIHQVKAYQSSSFSSYKNALLGIVLELEKNKTATGFIHTWKTLNPKAGKSFIESIKDEFSTLIIEYLMSTDSDTTIIGRAAGAGENVPKQSAIIRAAFPNKSSIEILSILQDIRSEKTNALSRLDCYKYPDGHNFCDLSEINSKIKDELSLAFVLRKICNTSKQIDNAFHFFLGSIDNHIALRHKNIHLPNVIPIDFQSIINVLETNFEDTSEAYLHYKFKADFMDRFNEFMNDDDVYIQAEIDKGFECNLTQIRNILSPMPPELLWRLYERFSPHLTFCSFDNLGNAIKIDMDGILNVLLKIFNELNHKRAIHDGKSARLTYKVSAESTNIYLPTTIRLDLRPAQIARRIFENPGMIEALFEINTLIYDGDLISDLSQKLNNHTIAPDHLDIRHREKRMEICAGLRLISTDSAKKEINVN